jgi:glucose-6-phosphate-specific signal transduction histidine kinase
VGFPAYLCFYSISAMYHVATALLFIGTGLSLSLSLIYQHILWARLFQVSLLLIRHIELDCMGANDENCCRCKSTHPIAFTLQPA